MADEPKDEDLNKWYGLHMRAETAAAMHQRIVVARFETIWPADNTEADRPQRRRVTVQPKTRTFMTSMRHTKPRVLGPGRYNVGDLWIGLDDDTGNSTADVRVGICATVDDLPFTVPFVFPDHLLLKQDDDAQWALQSLSIRTSDNLLGAARLEMSLECHDPFRLIRAVGTQPLEKESLKDNVRAVKLGPAAPERVGFWRRLAQYFTGGKQAAAVQSAHAGGAEHKDGPVVRELNSSQSPPAPPA